MKDLKIQIECKQKFTTEQHCKYMVTTCTIITEDLTCLVPLCTLSYNIMLYYKQTNKNENTRYHCVAIP